MSNGSSGSGGGIGFFGALLLIFITLKLCGLIHWSWWWVLCPIWIPALLALAFVGLYFVCMLFVKY